MGEKESKDSKPIANCKYIHRILSIQCCNVCASIILTVTDKQLAEVSSDILGKMDFLFSTCILINMICVILLGEDDFSKVIDVVSQLSDKWPELCHALGIPLSLLSAIRKDHTGDNVASLHEGLSCWLLGKHSNEKNGPPTWRKLVAAVDGISGGAYHDLALKVAEEHKGNYYYIMKMPQTISS